MNGRGSSNTVRVYHDSDISDASNSRNRSMRKKLSGIIRGR